MVSLFVNDLWIENFCQNKAYLKKVEEMTPILEFGRNSEWKSKSVDLKVGFY